MGLADSYFKPTFQFLILGYLAGVEVDGEGYLLSIPHFRILGV